MLIVCTPANSSLAKINVCISLNNCRVHLYRKISSVSEYFDSYSAKRFVIVIVIENYFVVVGNIVVDLMAVEYFVLRTFRDEGWNSLFVGMIRDENKNL